MERVLCDAKKGYHLYCMLSLLMFWLHAYGKQHCPSLLECVKSWQRLIS